MKKPCDDELRIVLLDRLAHFLARCPLEDLQMINKIVTALEVYRDEAQRRNEQDEAWMKKNPLP
jgi:hypothetical protein